MPSALEILNSLKALELNEHENEVLDKWQPIFRDFDNVTADQYRTFLLFTENKHWTNLPRRGNAAAEDIGAVRRALKMLNSDMPLAMRFDSALTEANGIGRAIASALLTIIRPHDYGVLNSTTEDALKNLHLWPGHKRTDGETYAATNKILNDLARQAAVTLWQLDWLLYQVSKQELKADLTAESTFNAIITDRSGYNLATCRFVRHSSKSVDLWNKSRENFEHYIGYQRSDNDNPYNNAEIVFQFIPYQGADAMFVGAYRILDHWQFPENKRQHVLYNTKFGENDDDHHSRFDMERLPEFEDLVGRVVIEWGSGKRSWSQWCDKNPKAIKAFVTRTDELNQVYEKIAAGVKYRTKDDTDRQVEVSRTVKAVALDQGCDIEQLIKQLAKEQGHCCNLTGIPFEPTGWNMPSPDRIDSSDREYAEGKIQIVCKWINFAKGNKPDDVFRALLTQVVDHMG